MFNAGFTDTKFKKLNTNDYEVRKCGNSLKIHAHPQTRFRLIRTKIISANIPNKRFGKITRKNPEQATNLVPRIR